VRAGDQEQWNALYEREYSWYTPEALRIIAADPLGYARNAGVKLFHFAHGDERPRCRSLYAARQDSTLLSLLLWKRVVAFPFGLLFPFAAIGFVALLRRGGLGARLIALFCATHVLVLSLLFVTARFRMDVLPFLILLAVCGASALAGALRARRWRAAALGGFALALLLVVSNWRVGAMERDDFADIYWTLGISRIQEGRRRQGCRYLERAAHLEPAREGAWRRLCGASGRAPRRELP
jgi:hypothetical protein